MRSIARARSRDLPLTVLVATVLAGCGSDRAAAPRPTQADVVYAPRLGMGGPGLVDVFEPPATSELSAVDSTTATAGAGRPAVIVIHGGAWRSRTKAAVSDVAAGLAHEGFVAFAPDYSLAPAAQWPAPLRDLQALVRFLRARAPELGIDPERIAAWGASAGGHLAVMLTLVEDPEAIAAPPGAGTATRHPRCAIDAYGPADLSLANGMAPDEDGILRDFLGAPRTGLAPERIAEASTTTYARRDASILIVHGTADSFVSIEHSRRLFSRLAAVEADVDFIQVQGGLHDKSTYRAPEAWAATVQFLQTRLAGSPKRLP